ncbi:Mechanosensitive ion channel [Lachnospiraceae bacterium NK3A20]|nr:Mechanosensitive ion channel [Lachnospiraceae bacterium NK3A20]
MAIKLLLTIGIFLAKYVLPFLVAWLAAKVVNKAMRKDRIRGNLGLVVLRSLITAVIWAAAVFIAMGNSKAFTKTWETVLTSASVVSIVLGLAAQETFGNVFAGISMSAGRSRPFRIGDRVRIGDADPGFVEDFTLRHVEIVTYLNEHIFIPNSTVASSRIVNYTKGVGGSAYPITISVAYEADLDRAMEIMADVIYHHPKYYGEEKPVVLCREAGESGVTLRAVVTTQYFQDNMQTCSECLLEIMKRFNKEGIEIPYNKLEILQNRVSMEK